MNPLTGKKITYRPTVIRIEEGGEFGKRWKVHLYGGIKGRFTLYRVTGSGLEKLQSGEVSFHGSSGASPSKTSRKSSPKRSSSGFTPFR